MYIHPAAGAGGSVPFLFHLPFRSVSFFIVPLHACVGMNVFSVFHNSRESLKETQTETERMESNWVVGNSNCFQKFQVLMQSTCHSDLRVCSREQDALCVNY
mgnify:FL=1